MKLGTDARSTRWLVATAALLALAGCGGEVVTDQSLQKARQRWDENGVRDYELEWTNSGPGSPHYRVTVHGGKVEKVVNVLPNGSTTPTRTNEPRYFGVEGLFVTIADDLAQLQTETPFGLPKSARAVLRFTLDSKYGYPKSYFRDVAGAPRAVAFDVVRFEPIPPSDASQRAP
jgi:hypothetical protein